MDVQRKPGQDTELALEPTADPTWVLRHDYHPTHESGVESRFALSNGFLGVRASRSVSRGPMWVSWGHTLSWASWPRTYVAGLFDVPNTQPPVPALVPAPDWQRLRVLLDGEPLLLRSGKTLSHRRTLDLRRGLLLSMWRQQDPAGRVVTLRSLRLVSFAERALGLQMVRLAIDGAPAEVTLEASFESAGSALEPVRLQPELAVWRTLQSGKHLAMASTAALQLDGRDAPPPDMPDALKRSWSWTSAPGLTATFWRIVAFARSDDPRDDPGAAARGMLDRARQAGWRRVLEAHERAWAERWTCSDIEIEGDAEAQLALRFAVYHLNSAANPTDERVSIGARALTGDAYLGHVFWDTDIYLVPFYVVTWPEAARALLMYRHHTLPGARAKAARMGYRGALYAWESTDTGEETTPEQVLDINGQPIDVLCGKQEQHISADVAYAVWQYWQATGDEGFLLDAGAEILLETARFWASRAEREEDGQYHIRGVIGPDEYHEHIDDSAFTNVMARWNIERGLEIAALLRERWSGRWQALAERLGLAEAELEQWRDVAARLVTGLDPESRLIEQFAGYFGLEDIELARYEGRTVPMDVVLGRERIQRSQVVKQADVVALLALLPEAFDREVQRANFRYYEPRCGHGSSLSRGMHAVVAARLGEVDLALRYFRQTAATDLADTTGGSAGGIRIAALGGLWQAAVLGFAGLSLRADGLALDPHLPAEWRALGFRVCWRGRRVHFRVEQGSTVLAMLEEGEPLMLHVGGRAHELRPGRTERIAGQAMAPARATD